MNTYNSNLHASVMDSLREQELEMKSTDSKVNASMFSLYYAEDAKVNANAKHDQAKAALLKKAAVKKLAVENSNTSTNVVTATNHEKEYVDRAVNNVAVCAANVQIASNAIVKLASDMGSIFTILGAANLNTDIYQLCEDTYKKVSETAYCAEVTSQHAMEASTLTAKVTAATVVDRANAANASVEKLLAVAEAEYSAASGIVETDNTDMANSSKAAKEAQGILEKSRVYSLSAKSAYQKSNRALNINLTVPKESQSSKGFTVDFDFIQMPFDTTTNSDSPLYPVQDYYIMFVKENKTSIFSMSNAENVIQNPTNDTPRFVKYPVAGESIPEGTDSCSVKINRSEALDTDGNAIELGQSYAVFVLAIYETSYKKELNDFEDYLSAPSATFMLKDDLNSPNFNESKVAINNNMNNMCINNNVLSFNVAGNNDKDVEYRCMFLPQEKDLLKESLSKKAMERNLVQLELKATEHKVEIETLSEQHNAFKTNNQDELKELLDKQAVYEKMLGRMRYKYTDEHVAEAEKGLGRLQELAIGLKKHENELQNEEALLSEVENEITIILSTIKEQSEENDPKVILAKLKANIKDLSFYFNTELATHVPVGSYALPNTQKIKKATKNSPASVDCSFAIEPDTTDNFGNLLVEGNHYIPVVLTIPANEDKDAIQFNNSLSDFNNTPMFKYKSQL